MSLTKGSNKSLKKLWYDKDIDRILNCINEYMSVTALFNKDFVASCKECEWYFTQVSKEDIRYFGKL